MDFTLPTLTSLYPDMVNLLKARDVDAVTWLDGTTSSNLPSGAKRWNSSASKFEKYDGTSWEPLASKYMINVDMVDGCTVNDIGTTNTDLWTATKVLSELNTKLPSSSYTANDILTKLKAVDGAASGLDADLLDGMHASSANTASTVVARDSSGNFSAGTITGTLAGAATTLTGLTATVAELNHVDGVTSNIQTQLNSKVNTTLTSVGATVNTVVLRDGSGDISARLFRSEYAEQTTTPSANADICFRNDAASDNYMRFMSSAAFKSWLEAIGVSITDTNTWRDITDSVSTTNSTISASATAVKTAYDLANSKLSSSQVGTATAGISAGVVGSYALASKITTGTVNFGATVAGSQLTPSGSTLVTLSGTWRNMGYTSTQLYLRIA